MASSNDRTFTATYCDARQRAKKNPVWQDCTATLVGSRLRVLAEETQVRAAHKNGGSAHSAGKRELASVVLDDCVLAKVLSNEQDEIDFPSGMRLCLDREAADSSARKVAAKSALAAIGRKGKAFVPPLLARPASVPQREQGQQQPRHPQLQPQLQQHRHPQLQQQSLHSLQQHVPRTHQEAAFAPPFAPAPARLNISSHHNFSRWNTAESSQQEKKRSHAHPPPPAFRRIDSAPISRNLLRGVRLFTSVDARVMVISDEEDGDSWSDDDELAQKFAGKYAQPIWPRQSMPLENVLQGRKQTSRQLPDKLLSIASMHTNSGIAQSPSRMPLNQSKVPYHVSRGGASPHSSLRYPQQVSDSARGIGGATKSIMDNKKQAGAFARGYLGDRLCIALSNANLQTVDVPTKFSSVDQYLRTMRSAMHQIISVTLGKDLGEPVMNALAQGTRRPKTIVDQLASLRRKGLHVYDDVELIRSSENSSLASTDANRTSANYFLKADFSSARIAESFSKGDIWILADSFDELIAHCESGKQSVFLCLSTMHGKPKNGVFGVEMCEGFATPTSRRGRFIAIHGNSVQNDLSALDIIRRAQPSHLIQALSSASSTQSENEQLFSCRPSLFHIRIPRSEAEYECTQLCAAYNLNEDQAAVLKVCLNWFVYDDEANGEYRGRSPPLCIVHGVFGAGKSHMLCVLILTFIRILKLAGQLPGNDKTGDVLPFRVLVCAATNTAVDRVLTGLIESGYEDFVRVGSIRGVAPSVMPYTVLRTANDAATKETLSTLRDMLKLVTSAAERDTLLEQIKAVKDGRAADREQLLLSAAVVGTTVAAATSFPIFDGHKFSIVLLDESSQLLEPHALAPLVRFSCQRLLCVGDPRQLPPATASSLQPVGGQRPSICRTMFERVVDAGFAPIMLRTQYRCHPMLAATASKCFYQNLLRTGIPGHLRASLCSNANGTAWPPFILFDDDSENSSTQELRVAGNSFTNEHEAKFIAHLLFQLIEFHRVSASRIGVICLYKAQAVLIQKVLAESEPDPTTESDHSTNSDRLGKKRPKKRSKFSLIDEEMRTIAAEYRSSGSSEEKEIDVAFSVDTSTSSSSPSQVLVSTVDAFQGAERDIIILACTRTSRWTSFADDAQRLTVAITRARHHLFVVGRVNTLLGMRSDQGTTPGSHGLWPELFRLASHGIAFQRIDALNWVCSGRSPNLRRDLDESGCEGEKLQMRMALAGW